MSTKSRVRVRVPYPNQGKVNSKCCKSIEALRKYKELIVDAQSVQGASISMLRSNSVADIVSTSVCQKAFSFDYYLAVDSDIEFNPENVMRLIERNVDIVSGAYQFRANGNLAVGGYFFGNVDGLVTVDKFIPWEESGLKIVDWVGAGFLLIKKEVFEKLEYPWFREHIIEYEKAGEKCAEWVGEDVGFCLAARKAGYKIHLDMDVKVKHLCWEDGSNSEKQMTVEEIYSDSMKALITLKNHMEVLCGGIKQAEQIVKDSKCSKQAEAPPPMEAVPKAAEVTAETVQTITG